MEYKEIETKKLKHFNIRDIRDDVVTRINERIEVNGFNPAHPLTVVENGDGFVVLDGNHRLKALQQNNIDSVPCVVYPHGTDGYKVAVQCNHDEDTYAPMDMFDWLNVIQTQKEQGKTQQQIGESIGWSRSSVLQYCRLTEKIDTQILDRAKEYQDGRVSENDTNVSFNFTEGWFRNSGIYDLSEKYQKDFFNRFIEDKMNWSGSKVKAECSKYRTWQDYYKIAQDELCNKEDLPSILELIEMGAFKSETQLRDKIASMNKKAKNRLLCGDSVQLLHEIEDNSIDIVITDPPYGIKYVSNRSKHSESVSASGILNDDHNAMKVFKETMSILNTKTKTDACYYVFCSWKTYPEFKSIVEQYAEIKNLIIWDKGNHGSGDLEYAWGNKYECIIYATKDNRKLNTRFQDIVTISKTNHTNAIHPTQKPTDLIHKILQASARKHDVVCDPFMGSGSTIKAVKEHGDLNYIGIELDDQMFKKASIFIGGNNDE